MAGWDAAVAAGTGDGRGDVVGVRVGLGVEVDRRVAVGAAVGGSLSLREHAAETKTKRTVAIRGETTRKWLRTRITYPELYYNCDGQPRAHATTEVTTRPRTGFVLWLVSDQGAPSETGNPWGVDARSAPSAVGRPSRDRTNTNHHLQSPA